MKVSVTSEPPEANNTQDTLIGMAPLMTFAASGGDLTPLAESLLKHATGPELQPGAIMDLSVMIELFGRRETARTLQEKALRLKQLYKLPACRRPAIRLLAIKRTGPVAANTPLEFLVAGSDIEVHLLYLGPGLRVPTELPEHDVMFVAIGGSDESLPSLRFMERMAPAWPVPVLNLPERIALLARDSVSGLLQSIPGLVSPATSRVSRLSLERIGSGEDPTEFPIIVRPVDSHAGRGLIKMESAAAISDYLRIQPEEEFFIAPFVDYRSEDGLFRKYRIALIDGLPYASHMAISDRWMIHYINAGMDKSAEKRAEEERFMDRFDQDFAYRHGNALQNIARRIGLDYLVIDCAETRDKQLLLFEADNSAIVHAMDRVETYPYKQSQMRRISDAFRAMLLKASRRGSSSS